MNIKDSAKKYKPKMKYNNISEVSKISTDFDLREVTDTTLEGEEFTVLVFEQDDVLYKMPDSVLKQLKTILEVKEDLKYFRVIRKGTNKNDTTYTVIPL
jgi:hypothetical protein